MDNQLNKVQINETIDRDNNGTIIKKGMMINIRTDNVDEAANLYRQLKAALNGKTNNTEETNTMLMCECGGIMMLRNGAKGQFYGCSAYPKCCNTKEVQQMPHS